jgi:hypothetical protein
VRPKKNSKINLDVVASHLEEEKSPQDGRSVYNGWAHDIASAALFSAFEFDSEVVDSGRQRIIREALSSLDPSEVITSKLLTSALARREAEYLTLPRQRYSVLTSISAKFGDHLRQIRDGDVSIRFLRERPVKFDRKPFEKIYGWPREADVKGYTFVVTSVDARNTSEAFERATGELDYHRGMWNYSLTRSTASHGLGPPEPLGDIGLGRVHTVHLPSGAAVGDSYWYQSMFTPQPVIDVRSDWERVMKESSLIRGKHRRDQYASEFRSMFVRYARALDGLDFDATFLKLWSLLELLTVTTKARYDQTIDRALFVFQEQDLNRVRLEHLRDYRNAAVHNAMSTSLVHNSLWQLKEFVDELIRFHIMWSDRFETWADAGAFLDLPREAEALKKRLATTRVALKYRAGG